MRKELLILFAVFFAGTGKLFAQGSRDLAYLNTSVENSFSDSAGINKENILPVTSFQSLNLFLQAGKPGMVILDYSKQNRPVNGWFFPGSGDKNALVIGGVHGSELSSIEVAQQLIELLSSGITPYYNVIIIPSLFPDNAAVAMLNGKDAKDLHGRYTTVTSPDPNRQMPELATAFDPANPIDANGRPIERENQMLLQLIQEFAPSRILSLHAIKDVTKAGIYADPRTDCNSLAVGFTSDSSLAIEMAKHVKSKGGYIPGNNLNRKPTALYFLDPAISPGGTWQQRNQNGSPLIGDRGYGVSLGSWASTAVCKDGEKTREAIRLITLEFPGYRSSEFISSRKEKSSCLKNMNAYASAAANIFLGEHLVEQEAISSK